MAEEELPIMKFEDGGKASILSYNIPESISFSGTNIINLAFDNSEDIFNARAYSTPFGWWVKMATVEKGNEFEPAINKESAQTQAAAIQAMIDSEHVSIDGTFPIERVSDMAHAEKIMNENPKVAEILLKDKTNVSIMINDSKIRLLFTNSNFVTTVMQDTTVSKNLLEQPEFIATIKEDSSLSKAIMTDINISDSSKNTVKKIMEKV